MNAIRLRPNLQLSIYTYNSFVSKNLHRLWRPSGKMAIHLKLIRFVRKNYKHLYENSKSDRHVRHVSELCY